MMIFYYTLININSFLITSKIRIIFKNIFVNTVGQQYNSNHSKIRPFCNMISFKILKTKLQIITIFIFSTLLDYIYMRLVLNLNLLYIHIYDILDFVIYLSLSKYKYLFIKKFMLQKDKFELPIQDKSLEMIRDRQQ